MMQEWFLQSKLGIFIHWGIYAVKGVAESWSFYQGQISHEDYMAQLDGFTASNYDPVEWARLIKATGATYAVLTTKHHDGVALWPTKQSDLNVVEKTPAGRDLLTPYVNALRAEGIKVGFYFSLLDWNHPDYATKLHPGDWEKNPFCYREADASDERWQHYLEFMYAQLEEICLEHQPDLIWFDGEWERSMEQWGSKELGEKLKQWVPNAVLNSRLLGYGDYATPEQGFPLIAPQGEWEFCVTMNDSWGFQHKDLNYKSPRFLVRMLLESIAMGGRLLLDIGPREDGSIPPEQVERLEALAGWTSRNHEVMSGKTGLPLGHYYGPTILSQDEKTLYLACFDLPTEGIPIKGLLSKVKSARILGSELKPTWGGIGGASWIPGTAVLWVDFPAEAADELVTIIALEFEEPIQLYRGAGRD